MFPSTNHFRDVPCPFFSRVACTRPYCHFKHTQTSTQFNTTTNTSSIMNIPSDANETLNKLITQLSTAATANTAVTTPTCHATPSVDITSVLQNTFLQSLTTAFTNVLNSTTQPTMTNNEASEKLTQAIHTITTQLQQHQNQVSRTADVVETVPEYRPTPIIELERRRRQIETDPSDFNNDEYVVATFSPPSSSSSVTRTTTETTSTISKSVQSMPLQTHSKTSIPPNDDNHSWVTPPIRRQLSSSSDYNDFDERKPVLVKKSLPSEKMSSKPTATVKPNIIENSNRLSSSTSPLPKQIGKKETPIKERAMDMNLSRKRPANESDSTVVLHKKAKLISNPNPKATTSTTVVQSIKNRVASTNGLDKSHKMDEDTELALIDQAFSSPKTSMIAVPLTPTQQLTARYTTIKHTQINNKSSTTDSLTRAETSTDGRRIAHQPKIHTTVRSSSLSSAVLQPLVDSASSVHKIPFKTRQEYLKFFLKELTNQSSNANNSNSTTSISLRAQTIEKEIFDKSTNKNSYVNLAAKHLRQIRSVETHNQTKNETSSTMKQNGQRLVVSHSAMLVSGNSDNLSFGIKKHKEVDLKTLTEHDLYTLLLVYQASKQDLTENGYPTFSADFPDKVFIKPRHPTLSSIDKMRPSSDPTIRLCCRCSKTYRIDQNGEYMKKEECIYHWGRLRTQRVAGQIEKTYLCCSSKTNSIGCTVAQYHVNDADDTGLLSNFVKTQPVRKTLTDKDQSYGIYALDCEMCYTIDGLELVRVSVINHQLQPVYETLVKPSRKVLDYNTRWSGITEDQLKTCTVTITDVQKHLLKLFNDKSILIGHSLESDLKALKIVHETIIDTSLVFPHPKGKPFKRALKTLMSEFLTKIIQASADGHDSMEDARSCMELMLWKVKQDLKSSTTHH